MVRMAQVFAEMAKPAGFNINVIVTPAESYWDEVWLKKPILTSAWSMRPPGEGLAVAYTKDAKWPETHWVRPDYDALLLKANTTVDTDERNKLYQDAGRMLAEEGGVIIPMFVHQVLALAQGMQRLRAAGAEFQPQLRKPVLRVARILDPGAFTGARIGSISVRKVAVGPVMLLGVWHTSWTVADLDRSIAFYRDLLGFELVETKHQDRALHRRGRRVQRSRAQDRDAEDTGRSDPAVRPPSRTDRIRRSAR